MGREKKKRNLKSGTYMIKRGTPKRKVFSSFLGDSQEILKYFFREILLFSIIALMQSYFLLSNFFTMNILWQVLIFLTISLEILLTYLSFRYKCNSWRSWAFRVLTPFSIVFQLIGLFFLYANILIFVALLTATLLFGISIAYRIYSFMQRKKRKNGSKKLNFMPYKADSILLGGSLIALVVLAGFGFFQTISFGGGIGDLDWNPWTILRMVLIIIGIPIVWGITEHFGWADVVDFDDELRASFEGGGKIYGGSDAIEEGEITIEE